MAAPFALSRRGSIGARMKLNATSEAMQNALENPLSTEEVAAMKAIGQAAVSVAERVDGLENRLEKINTVLTDVKLLLRIALASQIQSDRDSAALDSGLSLPLSYEPDSPSSGSGGGGFDMAVMAPPMGSQAREEKADFTSLMNILGQTIDDGNSQQQQQQQQHQQQQQQQQQQISSEYQQQPMQQQQHSFEPAPMMIPQPQQQEEEVEEIHL